MKNKTIIIVGAGIVGVTLAWYLTTYSDEKVMLLDQDSAGNGATKHSFAWLNVSYGRPDAYQKLRSQALNEWQQLDKAMNGKLKIDWNGAISWQESNAKTQKFINVHCEQGFQVETLTPETVKNRDPLLLNTPDIIAYALQEGAINPRKVLDKLLQDAISKGLFYYPQTEVESIKQDDHQNIIGVITQKKALYGDKIVLTAGIHNHDLLKLLDIHLPLTASPSILIHLKNSNHLPFAKHIISTPDMEIRALNQDQLVAAEDYIDEQPENAPSVIAKNALLAIQKQFLASESLEIEKVSVGLRPMPADEMPIIGQVNDDPNLYIISMHAAVTLAPLISRLAMNEILSEQDMPELAPYRLSRFQEASNKL